MRFIGLIPARGGSIRLPNKNLLSFAGKPLIEWTILAGLKCESISELYVSTDSEEIASVASRCGAQVPFLRPAHLSGNETSTQSVIKHFLETMRMNHHSEPTALVLLQPTSPLRLSSDIQHAINIFTASPKIDSLVSCTKLPTSLEPRKIVFSSKRGFLRKTKTNAWEKIVNSFQHNQSVTIRNGAAIYISKLPGAFQRLVHGKTILYEMPFIRSIDIDTLDDFIIAEHLLNFRVRDNN